MKKLSYKQFQDCAKDFKEMGALDFCKTNMARKRT